MKYVAIIAFNLEAPDEDLAKTTVEQSVKLIPNDDLLQAFIMTRSSFNKGVESEIDALSIMMKEGLNKV